MRKYLVIGSIAAIASTLALAPAEAGRRGDGQRHLDNHHGYNHSGHNRRNGYWRDGKWIALGILGAVAASALNNDDDCYRTRRGRVVCD